ncbi:MAG: DUF1566 domain-containing protein [Desulfobacteraceae bacterium]|nr:DUF1566 domain-containing protein [Desulfobacteraceae bacterium]
MKTTKRISGVLGLTVAFCFVLASLVQANPGEPIWKITQDGTGDSIKWVDHEPNPRFAIYDAGTPGNDLDDLVFDKETGLIWARNANVPKGMQTWQDAINYCRNNVQLGNRKGWRLPTIEELSSLIDLSEMNPALPKGHPFKNVQGVFYWSSTTYESSSGRAWFVSMGVGFAQVYSKTVNYFVWPVRGGNGYATGRW